MCKHFGHRTFIKIIFTIVSVFFRINYWFLAIRARNGARNGAQNGARNPSRTRNGPNQQQQRGANRQRGKQQQVRGRPQKKIGLYLLLNTYFLFAEAKR